MPGPAAEKLDAKGLDWFIEKVANGATRFSVADELGISDQSVSNWLKKLPPWEMARVHDAFRRSAEYWDHAAEMALKGASTRDEISKARELANHYRWRAKMRDPARYGDKLQVDGAIQVQADPRQIEDKLQSLLGAVGSLASDSNIIDIDPTPAALVDAGHDLPTESTEPH